MQAIWSEAWQPGWSPQSWRTQRYDSSKDLLEILWKLVQLMPPQVYQQVLAKWLGSLFGAGCH